METLKPCNVQQGRVVAFRGDEVAVVTEPQGGCGRCQQPGGCGRKTLTKASTSWVKNTHGAEVGEIVNLHVATPALEKAAWLAYGVPLLGLLGGAGLGLALGEGGSIIGAIAGLWGALAWVRWRSHKLAPVLWLTPVNES